MSDYTTDEYGNVIEAYQGQDPLAAAYAENPVAVIQQAAYLAAQQAASEVGQAVYVQQRWQYDQAAQEAAKSADAKMAEKFGHVWETEKSAFANQWLAPRADVVLDGATILDPDALVTKLSSGFRTWTSETAEEADRLQKLSDNEFKDSLIAAAQDGSYASRRASAEYRDAMRDIQR